MVKLSPVIDTGDSQNVWKSKRTHSFPASFAVGSYPQFGPQAFWFWSSPKLIGQFLLAVSVSFPLAPTIGALRFRAPCQKIRKHKNKTQKARKQVSKEGPPPPKTGYPPKKRTRPPRKKKCDEKCPPPPPASGRLLGAAGGLRGPARRGAGAAGARGCFGVDAPQRVLCL